jgi:hypothetical protein
MMHLEHGPSPGDQLDQKHNQCNHQQDMNEPAKRIAADYAQQPQYKEDYKDCPKHWPSLPLSHFFQLRQPQIGRHRGYVRLFCNYAELLKFS